MIVELVDDFRKFFLWDSQLLIKPGIENFLQGVRRVFIFVHQACSADEGVQHDIWRDTVLPDVVRKRLEIRGDKSFKICIDQGIIKVKQQG